ncbi:MAG: hypothetical protein ACTSYB_10400 [Candidatus Helarchaeota archaeon]
MVREFLNLFFKKRVLPAGFEPATSVVLIFLYEPVPALSGKLYGMPSTRLGTAQRPYKVHQAEYSPRPFWHSVQAELWEQIFLSNWILPQSSVALCPS